MAAAEGACCVAAYDASADYGPGGMKERIRKDGANGNTDRDRAERKKQQNQP